MHTQPFRAWLVWALLISPLAVEAATCSVSAVGVAFGTYDPFSPLTTDATGEVSLECGPSTTTETMVGFSVDYVAALGPGSAGNFAPRQMQSGSGVLGYHLYLDSARSVVWGDGSGGTEAASGSLSAVLSLGETVGRTHTVYGRIFPQQDPPTGAYSDTVTITLTF